MSSVHDSSWLSQLGVQRHACAFFHSADEEYRALLPFIKEGFDCGHRSLHIVDPDLRDAHRQRLTAAGIDLAGAEHGGRFELRCWAEAYLRGGRFEQDRMLVFLQEALDAGRKQGFAMTRLVAHMEWAVGESPGVEDLVEYETRINHMWPQHEDAVICVYASRPVSRGHRDGYHADASGGPDRRDLPRKPVLRAAGRVPAGAPRTSGAPAELVSLGDCVTEQDRFNSSSPLIYVIERGPGGVRTK